MNLDDLGEAETGKFKTRGHRQIKTLHAENSLFGYLSMAAKQHGRKGRKKESKRRIFCLSSWGCCGASSCRVSADRGDGESVKYQSSSSVWGKKAKAVVNPMALKTVSTSREIHVVVEAEEGRSQILAQPDQPRQVVNNKTWDMIQDKDSKEMSKSGPVLNSPVAIINHKGASVQEGKSSRTTKLSHSISPPQLPLPWKKDKSRGGGDKSKNGKETKIGSHDELDSMVGAAIVIVTLIVMLICGKVCAILCTAAWLYFIPRLRASIDESRLARTKNDGENYVDLDSWEYKNKVILQGLLERNHHL